MKRPLLLSVFIFALAVAGAWYFISTDTAPTITEPLPDKEPALRATPATYAGAEPCAQCHQEQYRDWQGSHHDLAMQHADSASVLGDFNSARYRHADATTTFFRRDEAFFVNTDGPDGAMRDFEVKFTFGVYPLQQYLVELEGGRLQALNVAWDSRSREAGGQKWFHLYPDEKIDHNDELHWTKLSQNWNYMCAECHSTNLSKNYDSVSNGFKTTWSEINVSCEACHGPGSGHVAWANKEPGSEQLKDLGLVIRLDERRDVAWTFSDTSGTATPTGTRRPRVELDMCARCHSRRSMLTEAYRHGRPLMDTHLPALLSEYLYHPDGQIREEDYEYGSFIQSRMFHAGVTCGDCHEPHTLELRAPGNGTCLQCHRAETYNAIDHHHHPLGSQGAACAGCHMPTTNYMVIDARHDHSIRVPRPDLSESLGVPNACNRCHEDKDPAWAVSTLDNWYGKNRPSGAHYGETLHRAFNNAPGTGPALVALAQDPQLPDIVRATAVSLLPGQLEPGMEILLPAFLADASPLVRHSALRIIEQLPAERRWPLAGQLLSDPVRAVRIEAGRVLAPVAGAAPTPTQASALESAIGDYVSTQLASAEHPQSHVNLGLLYLTMGNTEKAELAYSRAIALDPSYVIAYVNLADLYRSRQQEEKVEATLLAARAQRPVSASVEHSLGLHYVRAGQMAEALESLAAATRIEPDNAGFAYVYAVALHSSGDTAGAIKVLEREHTVQPMDRDVLTALVSLNLARADQAAAEVYARKLVALDPRYGNVEQILRQLSAP